MKTEERISQEAIEFADSKDRVLTSYHKGITLGYSKGAKSERNKTIDEAIALIEKDFTYTTVVQKLKSLKV